MFSAAAIFHEQAHVKSFLSLYILILVDDVLLVVSFDERFESCTVSLANCSVDSMRVTGRIYVTWLSVFENYRSDELERKILVEVQLLFYSLGS